MRTHSQTRNRNRQQSQPAVVQPFHLEEPFVNPPLVSMADNRTMAQFVMQPPRVRGCIVIPEINANFELKHGLINLVQNKQFFGHDKEDPHAHIRYFNKITSTMRFPDIRSTSIKLMLFPFSLEGSARIWLEKEPPRSILTWDDLVSKFINQFFPPSKTTNLRNEITRFQQRFDESFYEAWDRFNDLLRAYPHHEFSELHQLDTFYNALNANDQDSLNSAAGGNFLDKMPRECLRIIESKSKVRNSRNKAVVAKVSSNSSTPGISPDVAALTTEVSELKNLMKTMLIDKQKAQAPATVKAVEQSCVTCGGAHSYKNCPATDGNVYQDNIQKICKNQGQEFNKIQMENLTKMLSKFITSNTDSSSNSEIGLKDALIEMPKFNKWLSTLLRNKEKLEEIAITTVNAECSAIILNKVLEKLEDPGKFLIPCALQKLDRSNALADSGASINLLPHSIYNQLGLELERPTRMTSPRVPIFFRRPFMHTAYALIDGAISGVPLIIPDALSPSSSPVKTSDNLEEFADELTLLKKGVHKENFQVYSNPLFEFDDDFNSSNENPLFNELDEDVENKNSNVLDSDEPFLLNTHLSDKVECSNPEDEIDEIDDFLAMEVSSNIEEGYFDSEGDVIFLENLLSDDTTHNLVPKVILDHELEQNESIHNTSITFSSRSDPLHHEFAGELITLPSRENVHANPSSIIESLPVSLIPIEDNNPVQEEINIFLIPDDLIPLGVENDDSEDEDNELPNLDHQDTPSSPRPPPEPPDVCLNFKPDTAMNDEHFNQGEIVLFLNVEDFNSFTFVIWTFLSFFTYPKDSPIILPLSGVRIKQKSQENGSNRANSNTGTEEYARSREEAIKVKKSTLRLSTYLKPLIGQKNPRRNDTGGLKKAQGMWEFALKSTLISNTKGYKHGLQLAFSVTDM
ncbi:reverse transcriptase domain-containing protein [Tanacetum coccineum]